jgi:hypothetical protein
MSIKTVQRDDVKVLQSFIDLIVGIPKFSYPARQNDAPKPADEFAHIRLLEEYQIGFPAKKNFDAEDGLTTTIKTFSPVRLRFRVGVVDTNGLPSSKIMHNWTSEAMKAAMIESGYGFCKCDPISNETAKLEKEWEMRQGFSIELYTTRVFTEVVDLITGFTISGQYVEGSYLTNIEINE